MEQKFAIKRLSASDLTFFYSHYNPKKGTKQKAWNLDKKIFIEEMYPVEWGDGKHNVTLILNGPDGSPKHVLERKIIRQQKNMRLNGELIYPHESGMDRYGLLADRDFALMVFNGAPFPKEIEVFLISQNSKSDLPLYKVITKRFDSYFNPHRSMVQVNRDEIREMLESASIGDDHAVLSIFDDLLLEDVIQGGIDGFKKVRNRRRGRPVSAGELEQAKVKASKTGRLGEMLVNEYLNEQELAGNIDSYIWEADNDAIAPYDFSIQNKDKQIVLDVKTSSSSFDTVIHMSSAELFEARDGNRQYAIYRVYDATDSGAKLKIAEDISKTAAKILEALEALPPGVTCDSVSIRPSTLSFGDEIELKG